MAHLDLQTEIRYFFSCTFFIFPSRCQLKVFLPIESPLLQEDYSFSKISNFFSILESEKCEEKVAKSAVSINLSQLSTYRSESSIHGLNWRFCTVWCRLNWIISALSSLDWNLDTPELRKTSNNVVFCRFLILKISEIAGLSFSVKVSVENFFSKMNMKQVKVTCVCSVHQLFLSSPPRRKMSQCDCVLFSFRETVPHCYSAFFLVYFMTIGNDRNLQWTSCSQPGVLSIQAAPGGREGMTEWFQILWSRDWRPSLSIVLLFDKAQ